MMDQKKWQEINATKKEHVAGKITFAEFMQIVADVRKGIY